MGRKSLNLDLRNAQPLFNRYMCGYSSHHSLGKKIILFKAVLEGRVGIKKNGKRAFVRGRKAIITTSDSYKAWERDATLQLLQQKAKTLTGMPVQFPITLSIRFHFPNHQGEADLSNLYQGIEDILQTIGVIANDKYVYSHDGSRKIFGSDTFRTEIEIKAFTE